MFFLNVLEHTLRLPPDQHCLPLDQAITGELEKLFLDKVVKDLGLCISIYGLKSISGGTVLPGEGASTYTVVFGVIMFRPFVGEVIIGKIKESDATGLRLSLGFFEDIHVPSDLLPQPSKLNSGGLWVWQVDDDTESFVLPLEEEVRFRVTSVRYPSIPTEQEKDAKPFAPMQITASIREDGFGPPTWWLE